MIRSRKKPSCFNEEMLASSAQTSPFCRCLDVFFFFLIAYTDDLLARSQSWLKRAFYLLIKVASHFLILLNNKVLISLIAFTLRAGTSAVRLQSTVYLLRLDWHSPATFTSGHMLQRATDLCFSRLQNWASRWEPLVQSCNSVFPP